jgi:ADP-ribose pyrophosphatase YjhB (NUDIX family)
MRNPYPTTDIVIEYCDGKKQGIVLIKRRNPPYGLALPGGFAEYGLSLEENAVKEAREETGLDIVIESPGHPLCVRSDPGRDPRGHMLSIAYIAKGYGTLVGGDDALEARLYSISDIKNLVAAKSLAFDHADIIEEYLQRREIA